MDISRPRFPGAASAGPERPPPAGEEPEDKEVIPFEH